MSTPQFQLICEQTQPHEANLHYQGEICKAGARALQRQFELLFGYYQYRKIVLEIESQGGSVEALYYILGQIQRYHDECKLTAIRTTFMCASSAAVLLSLGSWGERRVDRMTSLLFHTSRITAGIGGMTAAISTTISHALESVDQRMVNDLIRHMHVNTGSEEALAQLIARRCQFVQVNWQSIAMELSTMSVVPRGSRKPGWLKSAEKLAASGIAKGKVTGDLAKYLHARMQRDDPMDLREAFVLLLIDQIDGVVDVDEMGEGVLPAGSPQDVQGRLPFHGDSTGAGASC